MWSHVSETPIFVVWWASSLLNIIWLFFYTVEQGGCITVAYPTKQMLMNLHIWVDLGDLDSVVWKICLLNCLGDSIFVALPATSILPASVCWELNYLFFIIIFVWWEIEVLFLGCGDNKASILWWKLTMRSCKYVSPRFPLRQSWIVWDCGNKACARLQGEYIQPGCKGFHLAQGSSLREQTGKRCEWRPSHLSQWQ